MFNNVARSVFPVCRDLKVFLVATSLLFLVVHVNAVRAELKGDPKLLKEALDQHRANLDRIATWTGTAHIIETADRKNDPWHAVVPFSCDRVRGFIRWHWEWKGKVLANRDRVVDGLAREDRLYTLTNGVITDGDGTAHAGLVITPRNEMNKSRKTDRYFDPLWYMSESFSTSIESRLAFVYKEAAHPQNTWVVSRDGDIITLENSIGETGNRFDIDISKGGNPVSVRYTEPGRVSKYDVSWQQVNGIWIPDTYSFSLPFAKDDRVVSETRRIEWRDNVLNAPLDDALFDPASLPLKPADRVTDVEAGISYDYKSDKPAKPIIPSTNGTYRMWLIGGNVFVVVGVACIWWRRQARR